MTDKPDDVINAKIKPEDVIDFPGGVQGISPEEMPIKFTNTCPCSDSKYIGGHVPLQLTYGATSLFHQETENRRMEVRVCAMCGALYYHCEAKENTKT